MTSKCSMSQKTIVSTNQYDYYGCENSRSISLIGLAMGTVLLGGCSQQNSEYEPEQSSAEVEYIVSEEVAEDISSIAAELPTPENKDPIRLSIDNVSGDSAQTLGSQVADIKIAGKQLLVSASADFKVKDVVQSSQAIESLTRQQSGYVALSNIRNRERDSRLFEQGNNTVTLITYYRQAEMTVRVPKVNINKFLEQVQQQVVFLNEQEFSAQDVTLDIYREQLAGKLNKDMASELSEERLKSQNAEAQSSNVGSITATYTARRQQELATLEQMDIADKVKYSTINLIFTQPDISYKEITPNLDIIMDTERPSFILQTAQAFREGWEILRSVTLDLIKLWWLLIMGGVFYLIYKVIKILYRQLFNRKNNQRVLVRKQATKKKTNSHTDDNAS